MEWSTRTGTANCPRAKKCWQGSRLVVNVVMRRLHSRRRRALHSAAIAVKYSTVIQNTLVYTVSSVACITVYWSCLCTGWFKFCLWYLPHGWLMYISHALLTETNYIKLHIQQCTARLATFIFPRKLSSWQCKSPTWFDNLWREDAFNNRPISRRMYCKMPWLNIAITVEMES